MSAAKCVKYIYAVKKYLNAIENRRQRIEEKIPKSLKQESS